MGGGGAAASSRKQLKNGRDDGMGGVVESCRNLPEFGRDEGRGGAASRFCALLKDNINVMSGELGVVRVGLTSL